MFRKYKNIRFNLISRTLTLAIVFIMVACGEHISKTKKGLSFNTTNVSIPKGSYHPPYRRLEVIIEDNKVKLPAAPLTKVLDVEGALFTLNNLSEKQFKLLTFTDKDCSHCDSFYPQLQSFSQKNDSIECVVIQINSDIETIKAFKKTNSYNFRMLLGNADVFELYEVDGTPNSFLLDINNNIVNIGYPNTVDDINEFIELRND